MNTLDCSEIGVGGSDNFFANVVVLWAVDCVDCVTSSVADICFGLLVDVNGNEDCDSSFDISCFCVDGVNVNVPNGCRTCELAVGWLNVKFGGFPDCDLSFDISCFSVDGVNVNVPNGCRTCESAVGWLNVKFGGFPDCKFAKENRGASADDRLGKGGFPDCKFAKENRGTFADDGLGKGGLEAFVDDGFVNWNGWFGPDVDAWENEVPNGDPVLA